MEELTLTLELPISAEQLYNDWLSTQTHSDFTGSDALIKPIEGSVHTAWDGYISGKIVELNDGKRILKTWRTLEFTDGAEDSELELLFDNIEGGCRLTLNHNHLQMGDAKKYSDGWREFYFEPMTNYYHNL